MKEFANNPNSDALCSFAELLLKSNNTELINSFVTEILLYTESKTDATQPNKKFQTVFRDILT
jgi:hypothetical protein